MARYTSLSRSDVDGILARYAIRANEVSPLTGGAANSSYLVRAGTGRYVVTVLDNHDRSSAGLLAALLEHLASHGIPASRPLHTRDHAELVTFDGLPVLVKEYLAGRCDPALPVGRYGPAGELLARVHAVPAPQWLPATSRRLPEDWTQWADKFGDRRFAAWLRDQWLRANVVEHLDGPYGLVHGDYFADNLVVRGDGQLAVLDWETASRDLLLLDLGMAIIGLCRAGGQFRADRAVELLGGYAASRPLSEQERQLLPDAVRYASLVIGYHRYLRHHVTHPDPAKQHLYQEIPHFVHSLDERWPAITPGDGWWRRG